MLQYKTIRPETLELLKEIQNDHAFKGLRLVGGTALSLQIGHRFSDDLDLFGNVTTDKIAISNILKKYGNSVELQTTQNIFIYLVNDVKVDIVNYPYPWLEGQIENDGLRLAAKKDIAAMKLSAITGRGTKKDFIDIFFLLKEMSLKIMLDLYKQKYHDGSELLVLKSLTYFDDAETNAPPTMLKKMEWNNIKKHISQSLKEYVIGQS